MSDKNAYELDEESKEQSEQRRNYPMQTLQQESTAHFEDARGSMGGSNSQAASNAEKAYEYEHIHQRAATEEEDEEVLLAIQMEAGESSCDVPKALASLNRNEEDNRPAFIPAPQQQDIYAAEWMNQEHNYKLEDSK